MKAVRGREVISCDAKANTGTSSRTTVQRDVIAIGHHHRAPGRESRKKYVGNKEKNFPGWPRVQRLRPGQLLLLRQRRQKKRSIVPTKI